jgi:hypothetical protein
MSLYNLKRNSKIYHIDDILMSKICFLPQKLFFGFRIANMVSLSIETTKVYEPPEDYSNQYSLPLLNF